MRMGCRLQVTGCRLVVCCLLVVVGYWANAQNNLNTPCPPSIDCADDIDGDKVDSFFQSHSIDLNAGKNRDLYLEIYRWYKTCYHYGGNTGKGIDCSHFVNMLYEKIYGKTLNSSSSSIYPQCKPLKGGITKAKEGDLLFFKIKKKRISHVGLYLQNGLFVHASTQSGVIISSLTEPYYKKHFYKAGRPE
jgi:lipoprotein Spr